MISKICKTVLYKWFGWKEVVTVDIPRRCILAIAPHTSNWDFILGELYYASKGKHADFLMKKEWFFWPLGIILRRIGGIPVSRNKKQNLTDRLAQTARERDYFQLAITPEGTRSKVTEWKKGFYYIALKANIPIVLFGIDYKKRLIVCSKILIPTGNEEADMKEIKNYYSGFSAKHPEKFSI